MTSSCCHLVNSEMLLDSVTLTRCACFTSTLHDQSRELFNRFSPFIARLCTVKLRVYQSISCLHFSIVVRTNIDQLCISISSIGSTDLHQLCVCYSISCKHHPISCMHNSRSVVCVLVDQLWTLSDSYLHNWLRSLDRVTFQNCPKDNDNLSRKPTAAD